MDFEPQLRDLLRLLLLSGAFVLSACYLFPRSAPSARAFSLGCAIGLVLMPLVLLWDPVLDVGMGRLDWLALETALPLWMVVAALIVGLFGVVRELWRAHVLVQALKRLPLERDARAARILRDLRRQLGIHQTVCLHTVEVFDGAPCRAPLASSMPGFHIVLPPAYLARDEEGLRAVLAHELVHLQRRDDVWSLVMRVVVCGYWFLPWLRRLESRLLDAMEDSCDDRAADCFTPGHGYVSGVAHAVAGQRLQVAATNPATPREPPDASVSHPLLRRILRFGARRDLDRDGASVGVALVLTTLAAIGLSSLQPVSRSIGLAEAKVTFPRLPLDAPARLPRLPLIDVEPARTVDRALAAPALARPARPPIYPGQALLAGLEGEVVVRFRIANDGSVVATNVLFSRPQGVFDAAVLNAVRARRYDSLARRDRVPKLHTVREAQQPVLLTQRFRFRLSEEEPMYQTFHQQPLSQPPGHQQGFLY